MPFTTPLIVQRISPTDWMLVAPLSYQGAVDHFTVSESSITDFASVPTWLQGIVQATGSYTCAAVLHDAFCVALNEGRPIVSSLDADGIFRRVMREEGVGVVKRWVMYSAVRLAALKSKTRRPGWWHWPEAPAVLAITVLELAAVVAVVLGLHVLIDLIL